MRLTEVMLGLEFRVASHSWNEKGTKYCCIGFSNLYGWLCLVLSDCTRFHNPKLEHLMRSILHNQVSLLMHMEW